MRFAILGLYNSGSSAIAGMLHRLGADLGSPFFGDRPERQSTVYEAADLACELRRWWDEPNLVEQLTAAERVTALRAWIERRDTGAAPTVGAKHPLLSLCGPDLVRAWGADTRFIWARRPLEDSVAGLVRRGWWPGRETAMQQQLWDTLTRFAALNVRLLALDWDSVRADPARTARTLTDWLGLAPQPEQLADAAAYIRTSAGVHAR
ncbi:MAG: hypothetical protein FJ197_12670 [Gammaproteobacteria bacterium]|nr:hypothetical protein [Gammaproteobacteria bacterium]